MFEKNSDGDDPVQGEFANEIAGFEDTFVSQGKSMFDEHKGKLAIGVAATLGVMIFYNWRERQLAKQDPEGHARLQRLKAIVRADNDGSMTTKAAEELYISEGNAASQVTIPKYSGGINAAG